MGLTFGGGPARSQGDNGFDPLGLGQSPERWAPDWAAWGSGRDQPRGGVVGLNTYECTYGVWGTCSCEPGPAAVLEHSSVSVENMWANWSCADWGWCLHGSGVELATLCTRLRRLKWYAEAEKTNGRWAMMAVAGILGQEALGVPVKWYEAGAATYELPVIAQVPILFLVMGFLETKRYQGFKKSGTVSAASTGPQQLQQQLEAMGGAMGGGLGGSMLWCSGCVGGVEEEVQGMGLGGGRGRREGEGNVGEEGGRNVGEGVGWGDRGQRRWITCRSHLGGYCYMAQASPSLWPKPAPGQPCDVLGMFWHANATLLSPSLVRSRASSTRSPSTPWARTRPRWP